MLVASPRFARRRSGAIRASRFETVAVDGLGATALYLRDQVTLLPAAGKKYCEATPVLLLDSVTALREVAIASGDDSATGMVVGDTLSKKLVVRCVAGPVNSSAG